MLSHPLIIRLRVYDRWIFKMQDELVIAIPSSGECLLFQVYSWINVYKHSVCIDCRVAMCPHQMWITHLLSNFYAHAGNCLIIRFHFHIIMQATCLATSWHTSVVKLPLLSLLISLSWQGKTWRWSMPSVNKARVRRVNLSSCTLSKPHWTAVVLGWCYTSSTSLIVNYKTKTGTHDSLGKTYYYY